MHENCAKTPFLDFFVLSQFQRMRRRIRRICANIFFAQLRQKRQNLRRFATLRLKKSLFCALYKGFPAAGIADAQKDAQYSMARCHLLIRVSSQAGWYLAFLNMINTTV